MEIVFGRKVLPKVESAVMELEKLSDNFSSLRMRRLETLQRTTLAEKIETILRNPNENPAKLLQLVAMELSKK